MPEPFDRICRAMSLPDFYPHPVSGVRRIDTHISVVFLTGEWVYKLKKPVRFEFLDFTRLEDRKHFCEQEVRLNRRLCSGVYDRVVPIYRSETGAFSLDSGQVAEYAVKMRQLPDSANLQHRLLSGETISVEMIRSIGRKLASFYEKAEQSSRIDDFGRYETLAYNLEETFREIEPFVDGRIDREKWDFIKPVCRSFLKNRDDLFGRRIKTGRIRDGHGDLKPDHIYFYEGIQIIDCIEFNDRFRYGDTVLDLAFLHMELDHLGHPELGRELLRTYAESSDDPACYDLLDFYCAYRALVRVKICCLSLAGAEENRKAELRNQARQYFQQAYRFAILFGRPTLWIFFGLPASGKSTLARLAGESLVTPVFQSDAVRKNGAGRPGETVSAFNTGLYRESMRDHVYVRLLALAQEHLKKGASVILDATFSKKKWRDEAGRLADDLDANVIFVRCSGSRELLTARLKARETGPDGNSDARLVHLEDMMASFEPFTEAEAKPLNSLTADTRQPLKQTVHSILSEGYALRNNQITGRMERGLS